MIKIGIDLGGTKTEAVALDAAGRELARERVASPRGDYAATVRTVAGLVEGLVARFGEGSVGVGIPGAVSPASGLVKNANSTWLNGRPLHGDLESALGRPLRIANDADCLALSESADGAAAGAALAFAVILGTGVGGGVVAHGRVLTGPNAIGGEWGHNPLPAPRLWPVDRTEDDREDASGERSVDERPGSACYCGRQGCIETWLSGPGLAADHLRMTGVSLSAEEIGRAAAAGAPAALATLERYCDRLARALAGIINILDPEVIVLGGGLSNLDILYDRVPALWGGHVFSDTVATRLRRAVHGDSSGVRGAAWLWDQGEALRTV